MRAAHTRRRVTSHFHCQTPLQGQGSVYHAKTWGLKPAGPPLFSISFRGPSDTLDAGRCMYMMHNSAQLTPQTTEQNHAGDLRAQLQPGGPRRSIHTCIYTVSRGVTNTPACPAPPSPLGLLACCTGAAARYCCLRDAAQVLLHESCRTTQPQSQSTTADMPAGGLPVLLLTSSGGCHAGRQGCWLAPAQQLPCGGQDSWLLTVDAVLWQRQNGSSAGLSSSSPPLAA